MYGIGRSNLLSNAVNCKYKTILVYLVYLTDKCHNILEVGMIQYVMA